MNKLIRIVGPLILLSAVAACQPRSAEAVPERSQCDAYSRANLPCHVALVAVLAAPERYVSTDVQVFGFLASGAAPLSIHMSRDTWQSGDAASSIRVEPADSQVEAQLRSFDPAFVTVSGRLTAGDRAGLRQPFLTLTVTEVTKLFEPRDLSDREQRLRDGTR